MQRQVDRPVPSAFSGFESLLPPHPSSVRTSLLRQTSATLEIASIPRILCSKTANTMLTEHREMLSPVECGALPSVPCPDRNISSHLFITPAHIWERKRSYPSIYRMIQDYSRDKHLRKAAKHLLHDRNSKEPNLPADPRQWSREDVARWIQYITTTHHLPSVHLDRFLMNGKALCLMSIEMFVSRVPLGGKLLYKDFQLRLSRAMYS